MSSANQVHAQYYQHEYNCDVDNTWRQNGRALREITHVDQVDHRSLGVQTQPDQALGSRRAGDRANKTYRMIDQALSPQERDPTPTRASVGGTE
ncbi:MAG: hypothetical protein ACP5HZ_00515 [Ferrimicrobium sp.]|uniref:hypothetical protein n=1 Tax=Ferrimicrobium sp. TaxID=2926050 RepID=UPI0026309099|nr:hypothetical protein [Ferrimicrobium sp.]